MTDFRFRFRGYKGLPTVRMTFRADDFLSAFMLASEYAYRNGYKSFDLVKGDQK